jgi:hypothetical protein
MWRRITHKPPQAELPGYRAKSAGNYPGVQRVKAPAFPSPTIAPEPRPIFQNLQNPPSLNLSDAAGSSIGGIKDK